MKTLLHVICFLIYWVDYKHGIMMFAASPPPALSLVMAITEVMGP